MAVPVFSLEVNILWMCDTVQVTAEMTESQRADGGGSTIYYKGGSAARFGE